jgi:phage terminase Nu1 subunit (DNA packaging protein)
MPVISGVHVSSINRLLWIYLKLLYSKNAMDAFFKTIDVEGIKSRIQRTRSRLEAMGPEDEDGENQALRRKSLKDTLTTACNRLKNYENSVENYEFIELELERLYSKIASLAEMGINRQDPNLINSEIDVVSSSIEKTEKAMNDLDFITDIPIQDEEPPSLLEDYIRTDEVIHN